MFILIILLGDPAENVVRVVVVVPVIVILLIAIVIIMILIVILIVIRIRKMNERKKKGIYTLDDALCQRWFHNFEVV